jgi:outer membrane protein insertion porin family
MKLNPLVISIFILVYFTLDFAPRVASAAETGSKRALNISGLNAEMQKDLIKHFPQLAGGKLSLETVDDVIRFLQNRPEFDLVQVVDAGNNQLKLVTEKSTRITAVKISGLNAVSESEAKALFTVNAGDVLNQDNLISGGEKLRQQYNQIGFRNASIDMEIPPDGQGNVQVLVKVKEGMQTLIGSIQFNSANADLNKAVANRLSRFKNDALTDAELAELQKKIRDYLSGQGFLRTDITGPEISFNADESRAQLTFKLDKVDSYTVEFAGNHEVSSSTLANSLNLDTYYSASPNIGPELASRAKALYYARGFARAEVQSEESEGRKNFNRKITLNIEEGPKIKIAKFEFSGNISRDSKYYTKVLKNQSSDLIQRDYYNKEELDQAFKAVVVELQNQGYLLAKINSTRTQYNKEKNQVSVFVNLDEGALTQIESVNFSGNSSIEASELLKIVDLNKNQPLRLAELEKAIQNLRTYYQEKGYIEMSLLNDKENLVVYNETNTLAQLNFKIYEGPLVTVATVVLDGNSFTKDQVILHIIDLQPGDIVTPTKMDDSKAKLQRAGYFNTVEVRTLEEKTPTASRTLIVKVTERNPGLFTMGLGATNDQGVTLRGYIGLAYNNILGTGRGVSARVDGDYNITKYKYPEYKVALGYLEPYLLDTKFRGRVNVSWSSLITDYEISSDPSVYKVSDVRQTNYSIERDLTAHVTVIWDVWGLATVKDRITTTSVETIQDIGTTGITTELDYRDNPFNPTRGNFTSISAEYSSPDLGSTRTNTDPDVNTKEIKYIRATGSFTEYARLPYFRKDSMVWANSFRGGFIRNLSQSGGIPYDKKGFYLGGTSTIRGFDGTSEYFPTRDQLGIGKLDTYYLTTVATMYLFKSELRFPLFGNVGGAIFYDGGSVLIQDLNLADPYRDAAGFGIHYNTPVGPLNIEFAWKLDMKPGESPWQMHLSIGSF